MNEYYVCILASQRHATLYVGMTNDLIRRVQQHRAGAIQRFTGKYGVYMLVHYEACDDVAAAIWREKRLKKWNRAWKIRLIEEENPQWRDLYPELVE